MRAGRTPLLKAYANFFDFYPDPLSPLYKVERQAIDHWLRRCPRLDVTTIFGGSSSSLKVLTTDLEVMLALARATHV